MITKEEIVEAIHGGVRNAHYRFDKLSGGAWMADSARTKVEAFLVSHIFRDLASRMGDSETPILELPSNYIKEWSAARKQGRPRKGAKRRRVDIALLNASERLIHLVEVKIWSNKASVLNDVDKLKELLLSYGPHGNGKLKSVFLSIYRQRVNRPHLGKRMTELETDVSRRLSAETNIARPRFHRMVWAEERRDSGRRKMWEAGSHIIVLSRRNQKRKRS